MQLTKTSWIIGASSLALIALIFFQLKWMEHSRALVEEQFDQKVTMALCSVAEDFDKRAEQNDNPENSLDLLCRKEGVHCGTGLLETAMNKEEVKAILDETLQKYAIDLDYRFDIIPTEYKGSIFLPVSSAEYSCNISDNKAVMQINFLGRNDYVAKKIGWMTLASIILLLSVSCLFLITMYQLVRQQRLNQWNIDFFNNMAHEFRTPLTNAQLALNFMRKKGVLPANNKYAEIIQSENQRLLEQVERVLHISSLEKGDLIFKSAQFSINDLLKEVTEEMNLQAKERNGQIIFHQTAQDFKIQGDILHVGNAIRNVLDNALKYCEKAPAIIIKTVKEDTFVKLEITDNGIGIDPIHKHTIFQKFYRITRGNQYFQKGFGLGLSYVKNVVEKHAGFLTVDSQPKKGSTFNLFFPIQNV